MRGARRTARDDANPRDPDSHWATRRVVLQPVQASPSALTDAPHLRLFADAGYQGPVAAANAAGAGRRLEIIKRPPHAEGFGIIPRRWVIERTFGWLGRNRRLAKDVERLIETSTAMVVVATIQFLVRIVIGAEGVASKNLFSIHILERT